MTISYVEYDLQDGFINNWLTAGPQSTPVQDLPAKGAQFRPQVFNKFDSPKSGISKMPVERGPLTEGIFKIENFQGSWSYYRCAEDHRVDHSVTLPTCHHLRAWAYTQLVSPADQKAAFTLRTAGPARVWVNKTEVFYQDQFSDQPEAYPFSAELISGKNEVLLRFEAVADPAAVLFFSLQVAPAHSLQVHIPTLIPSLERRAELEQVYQTLYLDRDVYAAEDTIFLCWPELEEKSAYNDVQLRNAAGFTFAQAEDVGKTKDNVFLGHPMSLAAGEYRAFIMPRAWEYYESQIRITHELPAYLMGNNPFSTQPYATQAERCAEALMRAADFENHLYAEIAKMGLNAWEAVEPKVLQKAIETINQRQSGSVLTALGLLGMLTRFGKHEKFPQWLKPQFKTTLINFRYSPEEPGNDVLDFTSEHCQILFYACEILAGQLYPDQVFPNSKLTGRQHRRKGEKLALAWMQTRGQLGFTHWDSDQVYADSLTALAHLVDLAKTEPVWGLASVLMDKLLFTLAQNSHRGVFASTQGSAAALSIKSGLLSATAGITRVFWGMGVFNAHICGTVSVALLNNYELPSGIYEIATAAPAEIWTLERSGPVGQTVNKVSYRTPAGMLSSAQDYRPGQLGAKEHIWQAALGPNCLVFTNHPACSSEKEELAPNFWRGNRVLPRVAQWKDALIALYQLPADDPMGFTHAYFPEASFDKVAQREGWVFGRKEDGFIAIRASVPMEFASQGRTARRELRAQGPQTAWLCQLGSTALDGDFTTFQEKVLAAPLTIRGLSVAWQSLRGEVLSFGWQTPFLRNGAEQALSGFKHFESPFAVGEFPCEHLDIYASQYTLRLDFTNED